MSTEFGTTSQQVVKFWAETERAAPMVRRIAERILVERNLIMTAAEVVSKWVRSYVVEVAESSRSSKCWK
jgi:hypothetical protein